MSGTSFSNPCPNCGKEMNAYSDYKPFDYVSGDCIFCGFSYYTKAEYLTLKEVNELRADLGKRKIKKLLKKVFTTF